MKKRSVFGCLLFLGICCFGAGASDKAFIHAVHKGAEAMMTFHVIDDEGHPVTEANIETGFDDPAPGQSIYNWLADTNGFSVVNGKTKGNMWFRITKPGFYKAEGNFYFRSKAPPYVVDGKWNPWNPTNTVALNRIKNPVPMCVKEVNLSIPEYQKPLGFDLEKGDWVAPHGKGIRSDIIFYAECDNPGDAFNYNYNLTVTFPNEKDGIQTFTSPEGFSSQLKSAQQAPATGYDPKWVQIRRRTTDKIIEWNYDTNRKYYFRVRTVLDKDGNIVSALYGKIYGDFLYFTYYLNPTSNDRNVEFDPDKNLFGGRNRFAP
jgi:hypothetical protein